MKIVVRTDGGDAAGLGGGAAVVEGTCGVVVSMRKSSRANPPGTTPSHLRRRARSSQASAVTLLAALLVEREREVTDAPGDLLIATVHRKPLMRESFVYGCALHCSRRSRGFGAAPPPGGRRGRDLLGPIYPSTG
ncbi:hypothetical protein AB0C18_29015 [Nonomuraea muscovyensis]|uniref:hypothetical protein n=1 Tax=Nonomuraea muscovyensis TaxID=1124761 RepID=UPI0033F27C4F